MKNVKKRKRVIVAMSGGVDSSVAALLLKKQGYDVVGAFMHFWAEKSTFESVYHKIANKCCSLEAQEQARCVAQRLNIPFYVFDFSKEFKKTVVDYFLREYKRGFTPNPCVMCNKRIKFEFLLNKALSLDFDWLATGHYIRKIKYKKSRYKLFRAKDKQKDQSYFLYNLTQEQLAHLLFPIGNYKKIHVRQIAIKHNLPTALRRESQGICFILEKDQAAFLSRHLKKIKPGPILTLDGKKIGKHIGLPYYTIGQRKKIGIGLGGPYYVVDTDYKKNVLIVTDNPKHPRLFANELWASDVNWIAGSIPKLPLRVKATIRYRHEAVSAEILQIRSQKYLIRFKIPQRAVTPGQSIVFYKREEMLGGGVIEKPKIKH